ncbi:MAG: ATP-binding protein [Candidatus Methylomirabilales bacterium]
MQVSSKILVVDDDPMNRELTAAVLGKQGHEVLAEEGGREALACFRKQGPWQLIILDLHMPGMSGLQFLEKIRESDPHVEVIILTGHAEMESAIKAVGLGVFDYLTKPFVPKHLIHRAEKALERHRIVAEQKRLLAELEERIHKRTRELEAVKDIGFSLAGPSELMALLDFSLTKVLEAVGRRAGVLHLVDEERGEFEPIAYQGLPQEMVDGLSQRRIRVCEEATDRVGDLEEAASTAMIASENLCVMGLSFKMSGMDAFASIPLRSRDKVVGALSILGRPGDTSALSLEDAEFVAAIGHQLGVAIENARLFQIVTRSKALWQHTFDSVQDLISVQDKESRIIKVNTALAEKVKASPPDLIGRLCSEVWSEDPVGGEDCPLCQASKTGKFPREEVVCPHLGGIFLFSTYPLLDHQGEAFGSIHIARDITKRKEMEEHIRRSEKLAAVGQLAAGLAHELGNTLAIIGGATQLLIKNTEQDHPSREYLEAIDRNVTTTDRIIRDLLSLTPPRPLILQPLDVRTILDEACFLFRGRCEGGGIRMQMEHGPTPLQVQGNREELQQIFVNLILNAAQAMPDGGQLSVSTSIDAEGEWVQIEITDTGVGIPPEYLEKIFDPFFTTKDGGTGLGLWVTYGVIQAHGGRITVESQEGKGTRFTVLLPAVRSGRT